MDTPRTPSIRLARLLVRLSAPLVPRGQRREWRAEWDAELAYAAEARGRSGASLARDALGAPLDAAWLRQRHIADLTVVDDLRLGCRQLWQQAAFGLTALGVLAIGMTAAVMAYSVVTQLLLRPLPYPEADRIVTVWQRDGQAATRSDVAPGNFLDWRDRTSSFSRLAGAEPYSYDYTGGDRPEVFRAAQVTEGFFDVFGLPPLHGRYFTPAEHVAGANRVLVMSARLWRSRFAADPTLVGRTIRLDDVPFTVVGVAPDTFAPFLLEDVPNETAIWTAKTIEPYELNVRVGGYWQVVGRLAEGRSLDEARAELEAIAVQIERERPRTNTGTRTLAMTLREHLVGDVRPAVVLFVWAVAAVLLIACVNVTNLLIARGVTRRQELAVRAALGASRRRIIGQLLAESAVLSAAAALVALVGASVGLRALGRLGPRDVPGLEHLHVDTAAFAFAAVLTGVVALAAGLVPALRLSGRGLQAPGMRTATADRVDRRIRSTLVATEVALAVVLVAGCGLLLRSFVNLVQTDAGFEAKGVAALQIFAWDRHTDPAARRAYFDRVTERLAALPGVEAAGAVTALPFIESNIDIRGVFRMAGAPAPAPGEEPRASFNVATPGYFAALRIPLLRGRHLDAGDGPSTPAVAVISEELAARYWEGRDPVGTRLAFRFNGEPVDVEVVGVVGATRHEDLSQPRRAEIFLPHAQAPSGSMTLVLRTATAPEEMIEPAKAAIWEIDPRQTFYRTATIEELVRRTLSSRQFTLMVLTGFAAMALLLAAAGLYGVLSSVASQYRREIGVRLALGARWLDIVKLVVARGLAVSGAGIGIGLAAVLGGGRLLRAFLYEVSPTDPMTLAGTTVLLAAVAAAACYLPARRAAGADPVEVLRD